MLIKRSDFGKIILLVPLADFQLQGWTNRDILDLIINTPRIVQGTVPINLAHVPVDNELAFAALALTRLNQQAFVITDLSYHETKPTDNTVSGLYGKIVPAGPMAKDIEAFGEDLELVSLIRPTTLIRKTHCKHREVLTVLTDLRVKLIIMPDSKSENLQHYYQNELNRRAEYLLTAPPERVNSFNFK